MATTKGKQLEARAAQRAASKDQILAKKPRTAQVEIVLDDDLVLEHDRLLIELEAARRNGHTEEQVAALEKDLANKRAAVDEVTKVLTFRAMGARRYDELVDEHPPTDQQQAEAQERFNRPAPYNPDTFPVALIAASLVEPELTVEEVERIWNEWNRDERLALFEAAMDVNSRATRVGDLGKGSG